MRNMRKIAWYLKAAALLPLATWNYLKKNRKMGLLAAALILVIAVGIVGGMAARHRRIRFTARLLDKPGSLVQVLNILAESGANILTIEHDKLAAGLNPNETKVHIACEVGGGVVPLDTEERKNREKAGRLACLLAARAETVVRLCCGLPEVLKGELPCR